MRLKIASRQSDLARWQAHAVARVLQASQKNLDVEFQFKASLGDQNLDLPLAGMGSKGVFTQDFHDDLVNGRCDAVVHSWKDLPVEERDDTRIAMTLEREDVRDVLLIPEAVWMAALGNARLTILTSSPRRVYNLDANLTALLPGSLTLQFKTVRGNVPTRLKKMHAEASALVLAKAGLDRLLAAEAEGFLPAENSVRAQLRNCRVVILPVSLNPPAPAQGALAVEIARKASEVSELANRLNDQDVFRTVQLEREILRAHGGGCHQKIGVARLKHKYGEVHAQRGMTDNGERLEEWRFETSTPWSKAEAADRVFPLRAPDNSWFEREPVADHDLDISEDIFVARVHALPADFRPDANARVWTAGVKSWKQLAARGIFVNGCDEGLGEGWGLGRQSNDTFSVAELLQAAGNGDPHWRKLSHGDAPTDSSMPTIVTYKLVPKDDAPDLSGKTHFFWMSGTAFRRALELFPNEITQGHHACGPGHTYEFLRARDDLAHPVKLFIGLEQFLRETL